jgi:DNA-binding protein YbaB
MDIQYLMRQAKKLEKAMEEAKEKLADLEVEAESGGGLVKVQMNGRFELRRLQIDPQALERLGSREDGKPSLAIDAGEKEMLEDLVTAAVNAAVERARAVGEEAMAKATGGLKVPGF